MSGDRIPEGVGRGPGEPLRVFVLRTDARSLVSACACVAYTPRARDVSPRARRCVARAVARTAICHSWRADRLATRNTHEEVNIRTFPLFCPTDIYNPGWFFKLKSYFITMTILIHIIYVRDTLAARYFILGIPAINVSECVLWLSNTRIVKITIFFYGQFRWYNNM